MLINELKDQFYASGCFSINQVRSWKSDFDLKNLASWNKAGYILKLQYGFYTFSEYIDKPSFDEYVATQIYSPSYISVHYALSHYGLIPEGIFTVTSVSSLRNTRFTNSFGRYYYHKIKPELMFGYERRPFLNDAIHLATLEKAILDLLYVFSFYKTEQDMIDLRFDEGVLEERFNKKVFLEYLERFQNKQLDKRANTMLKAYQIM